MTVWYNCINIDMETIAHPLKIRLNKIKSQFSGLSYLYKGWVIKKFQYVYRQFTHFFTKITGKLLGFAASNVSLMRALE